MKINKIINIKKITVNINLEGIIDCKLSNKKINLNFMNKIILTTKINKLILMDLKTMKRITKIINKNLIINNFTHLRTNNRSLKNN